VLPWTRCHVARVAARYQASQDDLWDEAVTALLRAPMYLLDARTAVRRACWRYGASETFGGEAAIRGQATSLSSRRISMEGITGQINY
jgi:hypothetical protein